MDYKKYTSKDIDKLNNTLLWVRTPIVKGETKRNDEKFVLHATGDCDMNGRKYVALHSGCNTSDPDIKRRYNLF